MHAGRPPIPILVPWTLLLAASVAWARDQPAPADGWRNCLGPGARLEASSRAAGEARYREGELEVQAPEGARAVVPLAAACPASFDLEAELRWSPSGRKGGGGAELLVGPHAFGSSGYRVAVGSGPWGAAECRSPRWEAGRWQAFEVRVRPGWVEYWLAGRLVVRCPAEANGATGVRLAVAPGTNAAVRRCRLRAAEAAPEEREPSRFVYPAAAFRTEGRPVPDGLAQGGQAVEAAGAGRERPLLRGQDAALGAAGAFVARFGLRGVEGSGRVWLEVARVEGQVVGSAAVRLEELPSEGYARLGVPFRCEPGAVLEFRVAAERGRLRVDEVAVEEGDGEAAASGGFPGRARRALPLADAWGKAPRDADAGVRIARLERRLAEGGWYEFRVQWEQEAAPRLGDLALDLWVACRDSWGIVRVFDLGVACGDVPRGPQETSGWLDPSLLPRCGPPVAFFAQVYRKGAPVAAAWRKWGIPVDDVYIVGAPRAGPLRERRVTE